MSARLKPQNQHLKKVKSLVYGSLVVEVDELVESGNGGINAGSGGRSAKGGSAPGRGRGRGIQGPKCFLVPLAFSLSPLNPSPGRVIQRSKMKANNTHVLGAAMLLLRKHPHTYAKSYKRR